MTDVPVPRALVRRAGRRVRDLREDTGDLVDGRRLSRTEVQDLVGDRSFSCKFEGLREVSDVQEVPRLLAVAVDLDRFARGEGRAGLRGDARIGRGRLLPRPVRPEGSCGERRETL